MNHLPLLATVFSIACVIGQTVVEPLYRLNLRLYRSWGWQACAERWERRRPWWIPASRIALAAMGITGILVLYAVG